MTSRKEINSLVDILALKNDEYCSPVPPRSLKSIAVLVHGRNKNVEGPMEKFIQKIVESTNSHLQCLWTAVPFLNVRDSSFNLSNMVAWKETKNYNNIILLPFKRLPSIESVACNKYMQRGDFNLPQLKQIECGFWKDVSVAWISCIIDLLLLNLFSLLSCRTLLVFAAPILSWKNYDWTNARAKFQSFTALSIGVAYRQSKSFLFIHESSTRQIIYKTVGWEIELKEHYACCSRSASRWKNLKLDQISAKPPMR